jgi:5-methyltetrahydropteroyltriglutamate--homocysteine methyltransferase
VLIPGVLESKTNFIEHPELIAQRIGRYANLVGRENVIAGSDCGYGTWVGQAAVDPDVVWAKLAALAEGARIATRAFWRSRCVVRRFGSAAEPRSPTMTSLPWATGLRP